VVVGVGAGEGEEATTRGERRGGTERGEER